MDTRFTNHDPKALRNSRQLLFHGKAHDLALNGRWQIGTPDARLQHMFASLKPPEKTCSVGVTCLAAVHVPLDSGHAVGSIEREFKGLAIVRNTGIQAAPGNPRSPAR